MSPRYASAHQQGGMVLLMVLVMLVVVGMMAVSGSENTQLQTRMTVNVQQYDTAYARAEGLLKEAEEKLESGVISLGEFSTGESNGLYDLTVSGVDAPSDLLTPDGWTGIGHLKEGESGNYIIEYLGSTVQGILNADNMNNALPENGYRITAAGWDGSERQALAVVQSEIILAQ
ncbi:MULTISPECIES: pilus assembly PilX family protein [Cobetia]|uniref:pilus assembly PilX family protein n=1 Tax=Cobetia TaxID=204286 RepID=UPI001BCA3618|nr:MULTISPECIES: pilus assembly protein [Cobetia]MBS4153941.1 pilus assembly protein [Cobetia sp. MC34]